MGQDSGAAARKLKETYWREASLKLRINPAWRQRLPLMMLELLILAGIALRFFKLDHESLNYDELANIWVSRLPVSQLISQGIAAGHPPAFNLVAHFWPLPAGSEVWARAPSAFFGALIIPLAYLAGKEVRSRWAGLWAAALTAFCPLMIWYSRDASSYGWLMFASLLSFYFLARSSRRGGWVNWALYTLCTLLVIFTFFLAFILVLAGLAAYPFLRDRRRSRARIWAVSHALLAGALAVFFLLTRSATSGRSGFTIPSMIHLMQGIINWPVAFVRGYANESIGSGVQGANVSYREAIIFSAAVAVILISLFAVKLLRNLFLGRDNVAVGIYVFILVAAPVAVQLAAPGASFASRYYAWAAPAFALLLAMLVTSVPGRFAFLGGIPLLAAMLFYSGTEIKVRRNEDWRAAMSVIASNKQASDEILCFPEVHCVVAAAFYQPGLTSIHGGNIESYGADMSDRTWGGWSGSYAFKPFSGAAVEDKIRRDLAGKGRVWLIIGDGTLGNYPGSPLISGIMARNWKQAGNWDLPPLDVGLFVRS